jgi:DNA-binding transcriptional regulator YiaG
MTFARRPLAAPDTLGERLRQLREERRLTLDELGRMLNIAPKYLNGWGSTAASRD